MTAAFLSPPEAGRTPKYPWHDWLDGRTWTLVRGRDYWGTNTAFRRHLRNAANARSLQLEVDDGNPNFITITARPKQAADA